MNNIELTEEEYKKIVIEIAIKIAPILIAAKPDSDSASTNIAIYANDIVSAVKSILIDPTGNGL